MPDGEAGVRWRRRLAYYAVGFLVAAACFLVQVYWLQVVSWLLPGVRGFDSQPEILKLARKLVSYVPWLGMGVAVALRLWRGPRIPLFSAMAGLATPHLLLVGFLFGFPVLEEWRHEGPFDAVAWRNQDAQEMEWPRPWPIMWPPRLCMVDDLIESDRLDGLTRGEVVSLLGEPLPKGSFPAGSIDSDIHYYLGPERGFIRIDSEWLFIKFDEQGVVARYWIYRD